MSNSLWPHGLQHARLTCPLLLPRVGSNSHPLNQWCYLTISSSADPFSFCLHSFPAPGSFPMTWLFASGGQRTGASASASVLPMNIQDWFPSFRMDWLDLLAVQGTLKSLLQHHRSKTSILWHSAFFTYILISWWGSLRKKLWVKEGYTWTLYLCSVTYQWQKQKKTPVNMAR